MKPFQKIILSILLVLAMVIGFFSFEFIQGFSSVKQSDTVDKVDAKDVPTIINVALIGSDARSKEENGRSDSLMVAQYDQKTKQAKLISIMRDSYVPIPGYGMNKINAAYSYGGIDLLDKTLQENFKLETPYYASITFQDFIDCVDELFPDGVTIDAEKDLDLDGVDIKKGEQTMDGNTLLQYARFREDEEGDFGRIRRQQQVVEAVASQLKDVTSIIKLPKAIGKLLGSIQTNLPESVLLDCGLDFLNNDKKIDTLSVPVDKSWDFNDNTPAGSVLEIDLAKNKQAISEFLNK
ncbi:MULTISPECIES: LCP family protein [Enterococcus]|uniref:Regulatory protein MsrR n=1 Tax=Candidatus Enterococcus mangumiae TaxID=2230878 RepID=A0ABZ2T4K0_9ENTE|nr:MULTISPECIES: LCP family protein [unclassified Enterococcus]MBO0462172.1 LCP family protein [Enterococcus sp. DIV1298c]MBO0489535.1 LCP family protein [Enterococcus sp. DIV1094]MBO1300722.1 LCP family protein [Enterococcus sp. DIV1271a]